ncbi:MAG: sigma-54 dependent transcriptional regulator [Candidatus Rokubacteria bacterium]|nr:sigma-54 dependent transcriptional regulator [Candidatus Rokubacteria bacterium]
MSLKILVVDDETAARRGLVSLLSGWGYAVEEAADGQEALEKAVAGLPSVVITDLVMPRLDGHALLKALREEAPFAAVILLTGQGSIETAVAAMKDGAYDYLTKPVEVARLKLLIPKAASSSEALREVALLRRQLRQVMGMGRLVGTGPAMQALYRMIEMAAPTPAPVLISGESGTGKELVARTIHELSPRAQAPFVAVNCAAIPETLLESEIFGHEKGAFTGALERRAGCFELAHQGTLFLDEIAEMNPAMQAKFLRILETSVVRRLGGRAEVKMDVRVLAATNKDPQKALRDGTLREDLYYRLNVVSLALPPLRDRREDIPLLIQAFVEEFNAKYDRRIGGVDQAAQAALEAAPWPGNVRELRNTLERAVIVCGEGRIGLRHLADPSGSASPRAAAPLPEHPSAVSGNDLAVPIGTSLDEAEKQLILRTLAAQDNNKTRAAQVLGISLKTLHNKLKAYGGP